MIRVYSSHFHGLGLCLYVRTTASKRLALCLAAISPKSGLVQLPQTIMLYRVLYYETICCILPEATLYSIRTFKIELYLMIFECTLHTERKKMPV